MTLRIAAVAAALGLVALFAGAALAASFSDATGDVVVIPEGAPVTGLDIATVDVTNSSEGLVTMRMTLAGSPLLPPDSIVAVILDLDHDPNTGDEGIEAVIAYLVDAARVAELVFGRLNLSTGVIDNAPATALGAAYADGVLELTAPRSELFDTRGFDFGVISLVVTADESAALDVAPEGEALWVYDLVGIPPPPPPKLSTTKPVGSPAKPRAGRRFTVTSLVTRDDTGGLVSAGKVTCVVRAGAAKVRAAGQMTVAGARCAMTVPKNAKGKLLRGTMTIRADGATAKRTFSFRVL